MKLVLAIGSCLVLYGCLLYGLGVNFGMPAAPTPLRTSPKAPSGYYSITIGGHFDCNKPGWERYLGDCLGATPRMRKDPETEICLAADDDFRNIDCIQNAFALVRRGSNP